MTFIRDDNYLTAVSFDRDGNNMRVKLEFASDGHRQSYARSMAPEEYGRFMFGLHQALGVVGPATLVRLRLTEGGHIVGIGHATEDRWFDPRPDHERAVDRKQAREVESALSHINKRRAAIGQRDIDADAAFESDDDLFAFARDLGWRPA